MKKNQSIFYLSIAAIFLSVITALYTSNSNKGTYDVAIYIEGDNANLARVADLLVDYDKNNYELVTVSSGGFFENSSVIKKDNWSKDRTLLMSTSVKEDKPALKLKFRSKNKPTNIGLSKNSKLYLANLGAASFPSKGLVYRVVYEQ